MEVLGNVVLDRWLGLSVVPLAGLALMAGCTAGQQNAAAPSPAESTSAPGASASVADLQAAAAPALDLVQRYVPVGYATAPVSSGYDWANGSNEVRDETLSGRHLLQIACSGSGEISTTVQVTGKAQDQHVACGDKEVSVPFDGKLQVAIDGKPGNSGVVAWRVLSRT
jgi:hypothetical protein